MLQRRLLLSLLGYFCLLALLFTAIMLVPGLPAAFSMPSGGLSQSFKSLLTPLPSLWMTLLPTVFMLAVLVSFSRLSLSGEMKVWRAAGTSVWPFARATALIGFTLGATMAGLNWNFTQSKVDLSTSAESASYLDEDSLTWLLPVAQSAEQGQTIHLLNEAGEVLQGTVKVQGTDGTLLLEPAWIAGQETVRSTSTLTLAVKSTTPDERVGTRRQWNDLAQKTTYPLLLVAVGLLILPLALSIDGERFTALKISAGCLLALNMLFILLMTDALASAGIWPEAIFHPLRVALLVALAGLLLVFVEERAA